MNHDSPKLDTGFRDYRGYLLLKNQRWQAYCTDTGLSQEMEKERAIRYALQRQRRHLDPLSAHWFRRLLRWLL